MKNVVPHIYNRIEIKDNEEKNNVKDKINNINIVISKEDDLEENKKLADLLGTNINNIETIAPMNLIDEKLNLILI